MSNAKEADISELEHHLGYWLRFVSNHVSHAFKLRIESEGVTVAEWVLMRRMFRSGPVNPSRLAEQLGLTRGAVSKLVERLIGKELAERSSGGEDRRFQCVSLTAEGRKLVPVLARLADENDAEMFGGLPAWTQAELVGILKGLAQRHGWKDVPVD